MIRLTQEEIESICVVFRRYFAADDHIWIFGSRIDMGAKGGDIDLYIETYNASLQCVIDMKLNFLVDVQEEIGWQKIDIVINQIAAKKDKLIYQEARENGIMLI